MAGKAITRNSCCPKATPPIFIAANVSVLSFRARCPLNLPSQNSSKPRPANFWSATGANRSCSSLPFSSRTRLITAHSITNTRSIPSRWRQPSIELNDEMPLRYRLRQEYFRKEFAKPEQLREIKQRYFGLMSEIDRSIGAILAKVDDLGLRERTIVALTSDHGDMMSAHGLLGKQLMFEQSAAVPCLVRVPGEMPRRCPQALSHIDFLPTLLDFLDKPRH